MNKAALIEAIAAAPGAPSKSAIKAVLSAMTTVVTEELISGGEVQWYGLGTFEVIDAAAHTARNPKTGAPVQVPARRLPKFRVSDALKAKVREGAGALA